MEVAIVRSNRRTVSIQVNPDATVTLRVPKRIAKSEINRILKEKEPWILKHVQQAREAIEKAGSVGDEPNSEMLPKMTPEAIRRLADQALEVIPQRVAYYSEIVGVDYGRITIRNQKTRWGSCSSKGNLNFNCLLMLTPPEVLDYVVVHELCHRKQMNHSKAFWSEVYKVLPNYKEQIKWLKDNGSGIMATAF